MLQKGFSFPKFIVGLLIIGILGGLCFHTYLSWKPRDLSDIDGLEDDATKKEQVVNLKEKLDAALKGEYEVTITEEEINRYIASRLKLSQSSLLDRYLTVKGVYVNLLQDNKAEVIILRSVDFPDNEKKDGGKYVSFLPTDQTVTLDLIVTCETTGDETTKTLTYPGGRYGQAPAPNQFARVILPGFKSLAEFFEDELAMVYDEMKTIKIEDGKLILTPPKATVMQHPSVNE